MNIIHSLVRLLPYWALPMAFVFGEVAWTLRKRKSPGSGQKICWTIAGVLVLISLLWFILRGDRNSDQFVRDLLGTVGFLVLERSPS